MIVDKAKKLLIPFIVVTLLYSVPLKYATGYYINSNNLIKDIFVGQILIQGNTHLWFLITLFIIFIIIYSLEKFAKVDYRIILLFLFALSFVSSKMPIKIIQCTMEYAFWFYLGYCFENIRGEINKSNKKLIILSLCTMAFILSVLLADFIPEYPGIDIYGIIKKAVTYVSAVCGCFAVYVFSYLISNANLLRNSLIKIVRNNSLGLYLYSDTLNYVILSCMVSRFGSVIFVTNMGSALLYFSRIIITFSVALAISMLLKKLKIKYIC